MKIPFALILFFVFFLTEPKSHGYETDQYTVPPAPLADIGEDISLFFVQKITLGVSKFNQMVLATKSPEQLKNLNDPLVWAQTIQKKLGPPVVWEDQRDGVAGWPLKIIPYANNRKLNDLIKYRSRKRDIVYPLFSFPRIVSPTQFVFASTIRMYDVYLGWDKIGHFINQGFQYFEAYERARRQGLSEADATAQAIAFGVETEAGIFGLLVDGVYSNADLAVNYAGFKFYQHLVSKWLYLKSDGQLELQLDVDPRNLLRDFVTDHWNESLNASVIEKSQRTLLRKKMAQRCPSWLNFYNIHSQENFHERTEFLHEWKAEFYGHRADGILRMNDICLN